MANNSECLAVRVEVGGNTARIVVDHWLMLLDIPNDVSSAKVTHRKITAAPTEGVHSLDTSAHAGQQRDFAVIAHPPNADTPVAIANRALFDLRIPSFIRIG